MADVKEGIVHSHQHRKLFNNGGLNKRQDSNKQMRGVYGQDAVSNAMSSINTTGAVGNAWGTANREVPPAGRKKVASVASRRRMMLEDDADAFGDLMGDPRPNTSGTPNFGGFGRGGQGIKRNVGGWKAAAAVYSGVKIANAFKTTLTLRERMAQHNENKKTSSSLWKVAGRTRVMARLNIVAGLPPVSFSRAKRPEMKGAMSFQGKTTGEVLEKSTSMQSRVKEKNVRLTRTEGEKVALKDQGDVIFETNENRMMRTKLRRDLNVKAAILEWWSELGFQGRKGLHEYITSLENPKGSKKMTKAAVKGKRPNFASTFGGAAATKMTAALGAFGKSKSAKVAPSPGSEAKPKDANPEDGFVTKKDYMAMSMDLFRILSPDMCEEDEAKASANEEWKNDSAGLKVMYFSQFFSAIFELCDLYTLSTDVDDYTRFLRATLKKLKKPIFAPATM